MCESYRAAVEWSYGSFALSKKCKLILYSIIIRCCFFNLCVEGLNGLGGDHRQCAIPLLKTNAKLKISVVETLSLLMIPFARQNIVIGERFFLLLVTIQYGVYDESHHWTLIKSHTICLAEAY